ncbi:Uncharacterised protein [Bordetella pertussis]|nr:Uncharacterised protein [Bordetella pertussis]
MNCSAAARVSTSTTYRPPPRSLPSSSSLAPQASSRCLCWSRNCRCALRCCWRTARLPGLSKVSMM